MATANITIRDLKNGRIAVKLGIDTDAGDQPSTRIAHAFLTWLAKSQAGQTAAPAASITLKGNS
jgi:hypothetical protein